MRQVSFVLAAFCGVSMSFAGPVENPSTQGLDSLPASDASSLRAVYEANRHAVFATAGEFEARNPGQHWTTRFDRRGVSIAPDAGGWAWGLDLESYGFAGAEGAVTRPKGVEAAGGRIAYEWDAWLEEWYVNGATGLEHGFTLRERPVIRGSSAGATLNFTLSVRGRLVPNVSDDGRGVQFENGEGSRVLDYSGLRVVDAAGRVLEARFESVDSHLVLAIDEKNAQYPVTIDPIVQQAYLKASNTGAGDAFGTSVAISGDTVVVGAPGESSGATGVNGNGADNSQFKSGAAYVFVRNGATWTQQAYLKASDTSSNDSFGYSVAIDGDTIVVGAYLEDSASTGVNGFQNNFSGPDSGAAYVFVRTGATWTQQAYVKASNTGVDDYFGSAVAVSGDTMVVGARRESSAATGINGNDADNSASFSGAVYVFARSGTVWTQQAYLKPSNTTPDYYFGWSTAISGDTLVVGSINESSSATGVNSSNQGFSFAFQQSGAAYVFVRNGVTWSQQAYLKASNPDPGDYFGLSVAVAGDTVVVGAPHEDSGATGIDGNQSDNNINWAGATYVFVRSGATWTQQAYVKASTSDYNDAFGWSVAVGHDRMVVSSPFEYGGSTGANGDQSDNSASGSGAIYEFVRNGSTWAQQTYLKASNTNAQDTFGTMVAMSGHTIVVGAPFEDSAATGVNGNQANNSALSAGAAYVFALDPWIDLGSGLAGVSGVPTLVGSGSLEPGTAGALTLSSAAPSAAAVILLSLSSTPIPAYCGIVVPIPASTLFPFVTDPNGDLVVAWSSFPAGLSGLDVYCQWLIADSAAPCTVAMSNAMMGITP